MTRYRQTIQHHGVALLVTYECAEGLREEGFPHGTVEPHGIHDIEAVDFGGLSDDDLLAMFDPKEAERIEE